MFPLALTNADAALRLANERLDGLRRESERSRSGRGRPVDRRPGRIRTAFAKAIEAIREVEVTPLPRLVEYPFRP